jgi:hypothetical protein
MPCSPDPNCEALIGTDQLYTAQPNFAPNPNSHYANMGYVGYVIFRSNKLQANNILRVKTAAINLKQDIQTEDVLDGRIDKTVYKFGPKEVDGSLSLPVIADVDDPNLFNAGCPTVSDLRSSVAGSILNNIWCWSVARGNHGRLLVDDVRLDVRYANHAAFTFDQAVVNSLSMSVSKGESVNFDINVLGRTRTPYTQPWTQPEIDDFLAPARVLTWNDFTVNAVAGCRNGVANDPGFGSGYDLFYSNQIVDYKLEINNNAQRFYSFNGSLYPIDVNVGKREITGSLQLLGTQKRLQLLAESNQDRFTEKNEIRLAFFIGEDTLASSGTPGSPIVFSSRDWKASDSTWPRTPIFGKRLTGVVFMIEELSLSNDVLISTVNYKALANDQDNYEAIAPATSCSFPAWHN